jgi:phosphoglycerol transferase MdoB-like AlkP superfamily enzyme
MNPEIYNFLLHLHSIVRWIILLLLLIAIFNSLVAGQRPWIRTDARTGSILVIFADLMLLVGLAQWYFGSKGYKLIDAAGGMGAAMKDSFTRFFAIEHPLMMLIAIIFIHIGKGQARKAISDKAKHKRTVIFYLIALIIILAMIPWPFRQVGVGSGWY